MENKRQWEKLFLVAIVFMLHSMDNIDDNAIRAICFGIAFASAYGFIFCDEKFTEKERDEG